MSHIKAIQHKHTVLSVILLFAETQIHMMDKDTFYRPFYNEDIEKIDEIRLRELSRFVGTDSYPPDILHRIESIRLVYLNELARRRQDRRDDKFRAESAATERRHQDLYQLTKDSSESARWSMRATAVLAVVAILTLAAQSCQTNVAYRQWQESKIQESGALNTLNHSAADHKKISEQPSPKLPLPQSQKPK